MNIDWIESGGGPLICASRSAADSWLGSKGSSTGDARTDYERACDEIDYLSKIESRSGDILVLGDEPLRSTFLPSGDRAIIARWVSALSSDVAKEALLSLPEQLPALQDSIVCSIDAQRLVLFDSALEGAIAKVLQANLKPGRYVVSTERYLDRERFDFVVHRFHPAA